MRLAFRGSPSEKSTTSEFQECAAELGRLSAITGHKILLFNCSRRRIGYQVLLGVLEAGGGGKKVEVELHRPEAKREKFRLPTPMEELGCLPFFHPLDEAVVEATTVAQSDALITLGGGSGTRSACYVASGFGVPVVPAPNFGGASEEMFVDSFYPKHGTRLSAGCWRLLAPRELARELMRAAWLLGRRSYFLSYSRRDKRAADHIELLLRRNGQLVVRDESDFQSYGRELPPFIKDHMLRCDVVLILWSQNYQASPWCNYEHEFCETACADSRVYMVLDDHFASTIQWLDCSSRQRRETAVSRLLASPHTPLDERHDPASAGEPSPGIRESAS